LLEEREVRGKIENDLHEAIEKIAILDSTLQEKEEKYL
jgi:hypothetical protein